MGAFPGWEDGTLLWDSVYDVGTVRYVIDLTMERVGWNKGA